MSLTSLLGSLTEIAPTGPDPQGVNSWLPYILGAGGAAFLTALAKFVLDLRVNAETRESKAIANLEKWRLDSDTRADLCLRRLDHERNVSAYWRTLAADLCAQMKAAGLDTPDSNPPRSPDELPRIPD